MIWLPINDWLGKWRELCQPTLERYETNQSKREIAFGTQFKTALNNNIESCRLTVSDETWFLSISVFIRRHEDVAALYGGRNGLDVVKEILHVSPALLKPNG